MTPDLASLITEIHAEGWEITFPAQLSDRSTPDATVSRIIRTSRNAFRPAIGRAQASTFAAALALAYSRATAIADDIETCAPSADNPLLALITKPTATADRTRR